MDGMFDVSPLRLGSDGEGRTESSPPPPGLGVVRVGPVKKDSSPLAADPCFECG